MTVNMWMTVYLNILNHMDPSAETCLTRINYSRHSFIQISRVCTHPPLHSSVFSSSAVSGYCASFVVEKELSVKNTKIASFVYQCASCLKFHLFDVSLFSRLLMPKYNFTLLEFLCIFTADGLIDVGRRMSPVLLWCISCLYSLPLRR